VKERKLFGMEVRMTALPAVATHRAIARRKTEMGFTLVELLVVAAIIALLAAMLVPAMEGAAYQARLASCTTRIRATCAAAVTYTVANQQRYPPHLYSSAGKLREVADGFRPVLRKMAPINQTMNDPMQSIPLDLDAATTVHVQATYNLWFGWGGFINDQPMEKFGHRWTYTSPADSSVEDRFSVIVSDLISHWTRTYASHQDLGGRLPATLATDPNYTYFRYEGGYSDKQTFDANFGYEDNSVRRLAAVRIDGKDERMTTVAGWSNKQNSDVSFVYLPQE